MLNTPEMQKNEKEFALSAVTNFIAQEIYRLSVMKNDPSDYSSIVNLSFEIQDKFVCLREKLHNNLVEELIDKCIDLIVFQADEYTFDYKIDSILDEIELVDDVRNDVITTTKCIFTEFANFSSQIIHKYPPSILRYEFDYEDSLNYYYGLEFIMKFDVERQVNISIQPPYFHVLPYENGIITLKDIDTSIHQIPKEAISLKLNKQEKITIDSENHKLVNSYCDLFVAKSMNNNDSVNFHDKLRFEIDLSTPITKTALEKFITHLRSEVANLQNNNRNSKLLMAKNEHELLAASNIPNIEQDNFLKLINMHTVDIPNLKTSSQAKNYLLGLIMVQEMFVNGKGRNKIWKKKTDKITIETRADLLSEKLARIHRNEGFAPGMVKKGYKLVRSAMNELHHEFEK